MTDRLSLIKARHAEAGGGNGDLLWLVAEVKRERRHRRWALVAARNSERLRQMWEAEVKRLQAEIPSSWLPRNADEARGVLDEAMSSGDGSYKP